MTPSWFCMPFSACQVDISILVEISQFYTIDASGGAISSQVQESKGVRGNLLRRMSNLWVSQILTLSWWSNEYQETWSKMCQ